MSTYFNVLTSKQKKVYTVIETYIKLNGIPPTVREIADMVGNTTPGAIQGILNRLEQKKVIKRKMGMARSIQLVADNDTLHLDPVYVPKIKKISERNIDDLLNVYNIINYMPLSPDMLESEDNCFLMDCHDISFVKSGISIDDLLLIDMKSCPKEGDIIMIFYQNHALLRKYYIDQQNNNLILKADNNILGKESFSNDEVRIIGKLVGKFSRY